MAVTNTNLSVFTHVSRFLLTPLAIDMKLRNVSCIVRGIMNISRSGVSLKRNCTG